MRTARPLALLLLTARAASSDAPAALEQRGDAAEEGELDADGAAHGEEEEEGPTDRRASTRGAGGSNFCIIS